MCWVGGGKRGEGKEKGQSAYFGNMHENDAKETNVSFYGMSDDDQWLITCSYTSRWRFTRINLIPTEYYRIECTAYNSVHFYY